MAIAMVIEPEREHKSAMTEVCRQFKNVECIQRESIKMLHGGKLNGFKAAL
jgi:hypothetical protein